MLTSFLRFAAFRGINTDTRNYNEDSEGGSRQDDEVEAPKRSLGRNIVSMCPKCQNFSARDENSNVMQCSFCKLKWCWICRQTFKGSKSIAQHFEFYNVFGCPGLARSPSYFFVTLLLNLIYALLFPLTLLFAPMIVMIKNYQGKRLVED